MEVYADIEQGSPEWYQVRCGIPTSSAFHLVMAKVGPRGGKSHKEYVGRMNYLRKLAGERITSEPMDSYSNHHMERGKENEAEARNYYAFLRDVEPVQVGFVRNGNCGASPDSLIDEDGVLEIKDAIPHIQLQRLEDGTLPSEHRWQVIGQLLVTERDWCDFMSHSRGVKPFIIRVHRKDVTDELQQLREGIDKFCDELDFYLRRYQSW